MIRAAGILFLCGDSALFLRRSTVGDYPGYWSVPGGKLEDGETAEQAAIRETEEETGHSVAQSELRPWIRTLSTTLGIEEVDEPCDFTTFLVRIKEEFTPKLCAEHTGYAWVNTGSFE